MNKIDSKKMIETNNTKPYFVIHGNRVDEFVFIITPVMRPEVIPRYRVINNSIEDKIFFPLSVIKKEECKSNIYTSIDDRVNMRDYISKYNKKTLKNYYQIKI